MKGFEIAIQSKESPSSRYSRRTQYRCSSITLPPDTVAASTAHLPAISDRASSKTEVYCTLNQLTGCYCCGSRTYSAAWSSRFGCCWKCHGRFGYSCCGTSAPWSSRGRCSHHLQRPSRFASAVAEYCTRRRCSLEGAAVTGCTAGGTDLFEPSRRTLAGSGDF